MSYILPKLPYAYDALEPVIDAKTLELHHSKHHAAYVNKLNSLLAEAGYDNPGPIEELIANIKQVALPDNIKEQIKFNAGGHYNHSFFWSILSPNGGKLPTASLMQAICAKFGSYDNFVDNFEKCAMSHLGSGWAWLCVSHGTKDLFICSTLNHDSPNMAGYAKHMGTPIILLDLWEHAYYLQYNNRKVEFFKNFWHIVDWNKVAERYNLAMGASNA